MVFTTKRFQKVFKVVVAFALAVVALNSIHVYLKSEIATNDYTSSLKEYTQQFIEEYEDTGSSYDDARQEANQQLGDKQGSQTKINGDSKNKINDDKIKNNNNNNNNDVVVKDSVGASSTARSKKKQVQGFYGQVFKYLKEFGPVGVNIATYNQKCSLNGDIGYRQENTDQWWKLTSEELNNCLQLSQEQRLMLKEAHSNYVHALSKLVLPKDTYSGDGIVTVGGGKFSMMAFLIIKTVRNFGTTLPVEVFIPPNDEGDDEFCNVLLPQYNAKCIYLSDAFPPDLIEKSDFKGYQFKSLAIIASSFKNLLLLDADNFPIKPLDGIFEEKSYKDTGLILWPDFWRRTTHPSYYSIANEQISSERIRNTMDDVTPPSVYTKDLKDLSDVPLHDLDGTIPDASTESGQLMINKLKHFPTVLLSLYYNVYGPSWYYSIFSQRSSGEGDKETFIAAAHFYDLPFYQVRSEPRVDGYHRHNNEGFRGVCMLQHDFAQDYKRYRQAQNEIGTKYTNEPDDYDPNYNYQENYLGKYFTNDPVDVMFVHSHLPKFDPVELALSQDLIQDGKHIRSYRNLKRMNGYDLELEVFKTFKEYVCDKRVHFKYFDKAVKLESNWGIICNYVNERLGYLIESHSEAMEGRF
ncbi:Mnn2 [Kluyveromyces lactis]|nr:Mnn2 [Kluyveromyces lactis]